jgi:hypothetical protein
MGLPELARDQRVLELRQERISSSGDGGWQTRVTVTKRVKLASQRGDDSENSDLNCDTISDPAAMALRGGVAANDTRSPPPKD